VVDGDDPLFPRGQVLRGHEFHYTRVAAGGDAARTAWSVRRGTGSFGGRDGIVLGNVLAGYLHLHALGTPSWAPALVRAAARFRAGQARAPGCMQPPENAG